MQSRKEERAKWLKNKLEEISNGAVVVEGKHDVQAMGKLGIQAYTFYQVLRNPQMLANKKVYVLFDLDNGGEDKREKLERAVEGVKNCELDFSTGEKMLKRLNITSVEQMAKPALDLLMLIRGE